MNELKYDRYFRFEIIYDDEINALGVGLEEYLPHKQGNNSVFCASLYVTGDDDTEAINKVMELIINRTSDGEKVTVLERGMYYIDLRDLYSYIAFLYIISDRIGNVYDLAIL